MTIDTQITTEAPSAETVAYFTPMIEALTCGSEVNDLITHPDASPWLINAIGVHLRTYRYDIFESSEIIDTLRLVLTSPHLNEEGVQIWDKVHWMLHRVAADMLRQKEQISPMALYAAVGTYPSGDVDIRLLVLKHQYVSETLVARLAGDYRVTVTREVAKHPLLTEATGLKFAKDNDAKVRANICKQPWCPEETLYLLRDDVNSVVSRAARRALKSRGLSETDEMDAAMDDEVSLFFLTASDDEDTLVRIGSSPVATEDSLRTVAAYSDRCRLAVAGNPATPPALLEELSFSEAENGGWKSKVGSVLAGNPANTIAGVETLLTHGRYNHELIAAAFLHPEISAEMVNEYAHRHTSRLRINAIKTGLLTEESVDRLIRYEGRGTVLNAFIVEMGSELSSDNLRCGYRNCMSEKVSALYAEELTRRGEPLELVVSD